MIRFLRFSDAGFADAFRQISERGETTPPGVLETVQGILTDVRERGDAALCEYTERFDRLKLEAGSLEVSAQEIKQALAAVDSETLATLQLAADRIAAFHSKQKEETWLSSDEPGIQLGKGDAYTVLQPVQELLRQESKSFTIEFTLLLSNVRPKDYEHKRFCGKEQMCMDSIVPSRESSYKL